MRHCNRCGKSKSSAGSTGKSRPVKKNHRVTSIMMHITKIAQNFKQTL